MRKGIICAGTLVVDLIKVIDRYPREGMLGNIITEFKNGGGAAFNVPVNISVMDKKIPLFTAGLLHRDEFGKYLLRQLKYYGINTDNIKFTNTEPTSFTDVITSKKSGNRTFFHRKGSNSLLDIEHLSNINSKAKIFHLGYLMLLDKLDSPDLQYGTRAAKLLSSLRDKGYIITVDFVTVENKKYEQIILPSLQYIDYLLINEIEAFKSTGIKTREKGKLSECSLTKAALKLLNEGVNRSVIIHAPEGGFALSKSGEKEFISSNFIKKRDIKGSVGAGDAFCAGFLYSLHENYSLTKSLIVANTSAWYNLHSESSTGGAVAIETILNSMN